MIGTYLSLGRMFPHLFLYFLIIHDLMERILKSIESNILHRSLFVSKFESLNLLVTEQVQTIIVDFKSEFYLKK